MVIALARCHCKRNLLKKKNKARESTNNSISYKTGPLPDIPKDLDSGVYPILVGNTTEKDFDKRDKRGESSIYESMINDSPLYSRPIEMRVSRIEDSYVAPQLCRKCSTTMSN